MIRRRRGFTLIELLVVIAIIAILAAMLFPVFARARESARKIQCLSNMKNIAMGVQLYLTDYDRFPPGEYRTEVLAHFGGSDCVVGAERMATLANPYVRWVVVFDEYIKNRDIWRCPSAKLPSYVGVVRAGPDWFQNLLSTGTCACEPAYPPGWGGTITDSANGPAGAGCTSFGDENTGATEIDYGARETSLAGKKLSTVDDASRYIAFGERGYKTDWTTIEHIAYPDVCRADKYAMYHGCNNEAPGWIEEYWSDPSTRKQYARHLGGDNIAFLDGHAAWWAADAMIAGAGNWQNPHPQLHGTFCACDNTCPWFSAADGRLGD